MNNLKVFIIDPHSCFSRAAANFLLAGGKVAAVKTASCITEALKAADLYKPDLLLIDDRLMSEAFIESDLLNKISQNLPEAKIVIMSLYSKSNNPCLQPDCDHKNIYKWVSKQDFAAELLLLLNSCLTESG